RTRNGWALHTSSKGWKCLHTLTRDRAVMRPETRSLATLERATSLLSSRVHGPVPIRLPAPLIRMNSDSVSPLAPPWEDQPVEVATDNWLAVSETDRSIRRDLREIFVDELWAYRGLAYELMRRDIRVRYKQTVLGFAWAVLMPMLVVMAGATVRYAMAYIG